MPDVARAPIHAPLAVQAFAWVDDHVSTELWPAVTEAGARAIAMVGTAAGGAAMTVSVADFAVEPPAPSQVTV